MNQRARPLGITLLAVLHFVVALLFLVGGLIRLTRGSGSHPAEDPLVREMVEEITRQYGPGVVFVAVSAIPAGIDALLGWGLWTLRNWARKVVLVLVYIGVVFTLAGLLRQPLRVMHVVYLGLCGLVIWYLSRASVRAAFTRAAAQSIPSSEPRLG
jgi:hypothetical protein